MPHQDQDNSNDDVANTSQSPTKKNSNDEITQRLPEIPPQTPELNKSKLSDFGTPSTTISPTGAVKGSPSTNSSGTPDASGHGGTIQTTAGLLFGVGGGVESFDPYMSLPSDDTDRPAKRIRRSRAQSVPSSSGNSTSDAPDLDNDYGDSSTNKTTSYNTESKAGTGKNK